jgi:glycosyltransferase involved in cell wall biosynthesis
MRGELQSLAESLSVQSCVHFAGYQSQPQRFLAAMDFFALTSRSEGMPLAVLEAWAAGLPVVASRVGGVPELIEANQSGLLFESGDAVALTAAMGRLLDNVPLAAHLRAEGRRRVMDQYTIERTARDYQDLYEQCLRASAHGAPPLAHSTTAA